MLATSSMYGVGLLFSELLVILVMNIITLVLIATLALLTNAASTNSGAQFNNHNPRDSCMTGMLP